MDIEYDGEVIGQRRADFLVENKIVVELKAIIALDDLQLAQVMNFLRVYQKLCETLLLHFP